MPLEVQQVTTFNFSMQVGETRFNFGIPAETRAEAINKLIAALEKIMQELKAISKPGSN